MTSGLGVLTVWSGASEVRTVQIRNKLVEAPDGEPPLRMVGRPVTVPPGTTRVTIGRSSQCDVVIPDEWLSRCAVVLDRSRTGWTAELWNGRGTEHRAWGQVDQPLLGMRTSSGSGQQPALVALRGGQHAFLFKCGEHNERTVCVSLERRDDDPDDGPSAPVRITGDVTTPRGRAGDPPSAAVIDKFRQIYWEFLVWPPRLRPEAVSPASFRVQASDPHARILRYVVAMGFTMPERPHGVQETLPAQLVEIGLLRFEEHALWRDETGAISPFLTDAEKEARRRLVRR